MNGGNFTPAIYPRVELTRLPPVRLFRLIQLRQCGCTKTGSQSIYFYSRLFAITASRTVHSPRRHARLQDIVRCEAIYFTVAGTVLTGPPDRTSRRRLDGRGAAAEVPTGPPPTRSIRAPSDHRAALTAIWERSTGVGRLGGTATDVASWRVTDGRWTGKCPAWDSRKR